MRDEIRELISGSMGGIVSTAAGHPLGKGVTTSYSNAAGDVSLQQLEKIKLI